MSNAKIKNITMKVLEISEVSVESGSVALDPVSVSLKKGQLAYPGAPFYFGKMRWKDEVKGKKHTVDMVEAVFSSKGDAGDQGSVELKISLKGGNKFNLNTPVSTVPVTNPTPEQQSLHCIEVDSAVGSDLTLRFLEPAQGEVVTYPVVYFITDQGIIDPGLGAKRRPT
ncbi:MAG: hypothetical protein ACJA2E_000037 [Arenicella sp.]|jgi:hypothetical protein